MGSICRRIFRFKYLDMNNINGLINSTLNSNKLFSKMANNDQEPAPVFVKKDEVHAFVVRCMVAVGAKKEHAVSLSDLLVSADYRGHFSHGLNRLAMYINDIKGGTTVGNKEPTIEKETVATAFVNGNNILGPVVGKFCIELAIKKAKDVGIGWVCAKGSNHFGIAGWYSIRAVEEGMVGMAYCNTSPLVVPCRARKPALGTNPISVAAPANNDDSFVLDMATSTVALGKIELAKRKETSMPNGWGVDKEGQESNDPGAVLDGGGQMPLGGSEICGGYKGYGLAMMVELFCGILSGSSFGPNIRKWNTVHQTEEANLGQCFVAINPAMFADGFTDRMSTLNDQMRDLQPIEGETEVLVPGDPERKHMQLCDSEGGIPYHPNQIKYATELAQSLSVEDLKTNQ
ncbi:unnamed protein product [Owenia fusiformis]|uniref:Malate dehydrogenase n=1 Tax=Owenia fusiformis TaxID=6347 RepID=A0A8S4PWV0_OWEFU|nr:unnamed protein product [Owenia fusiformis]